MPAFNSRRTILYIAVTGWLTCSNYVKSFSFLQIQRRRQQQRTTTGSTGSSALRVLNMVVSSDTNQQQQQQQQQIISPFDNSASMEDDSDGSNAVTATTSTTTTVTNNNHELLDLTYENVELVLEGMRHFLIQDGGNVIIDEIDGPIVKLQLQGNCGTCPSSTQTMKMGLERGLKERIPEIQEVIQSLPEGPPLISDQIEIVLDGVRPFLQIVGGNIALDRIEGLDSIQPSIILQMSGSSASLNSVKLEIAQRLQRHFMMSGLQIHWKEE